MVKDFNYVLYGLDDYQEILKDILTNCSAEHFAIELLLTEALTNAYIHGNKSDSEKPINVKITLDKDIISLEVSDCGSGYCDVAIPREITEDELLKDGGRGLYLIQCFADKVQLSRNTIIIQKKLHA